MSRRINFKNRYHVLLMMEELHTDSIDGGHEAIYRLGHVPGRGCTPTINHINSAKIKKQKKAFLKTVRDTSIFSPGKLSRRDSNSSIKILKIS
jgi:hypothetical protein